MQKKKSVSEADHNDYRQLNVVNGIHFPYIKPLALYKWGSSDAKPINSAEQAMD